MKLNIKIKPNHDRKKRWWLGKLLLILISVSGLINKAQACSPGIVNVNAPSSIDVTPSLPIGSVVATVNMSFPFTPVQGGCNALIRWNGVSTLERFIGKGVPNGALYPTAVPGLSYRGKYVIAGFPGTQNYWPVDFMGNPGAPNLSAGTLLVEFVKTGSMATGGTLEPQVIMTYYIQGYPWIDFTLATPIIINPTNPACTITQSAITVNLDDTTTDQLAAVGNTSKDKVFSIPLKCTSAANISLAFSGTMADSSNAVFSNLSGSGNASSVGVQILKDNTPVPTTVGSYLNLGAINGSISVPLTARYYALSNNADAGAVSAIAYASIVYN